eukprot:403351283
MNDSSLRHNQYRVEVSMDGISPQSNSCKSSKYRQFFSHQNTPVRQQKSRRREMGHSQEKENNLRQNLEWSLNRSNSQNTTSRALQSLESITTQKIQINQKMPLRSPKSSYSNQTTPIKQDINRHQLQKINTIAYQQDTSPIQNNKHQIDTISQQSFKHHKRSQSLQSFKYSSNLQGLQSPEANHKQQKNINDRTKQVQKAFQEFQDLDNIEVGISSPEPFYNRTNNINTIQQYNNRNYEQYRSIQQSATQLKSHQNHFQDNNQNQQQTLYQKLSRHNPSLINETHGFRHIDDNNNMSNILQYEVPDVKPSFEYHEQQQYIKDNGQKFDISKNLYPSLVGQKLNKDGLIPGKIVDSCFQDILSQDPFIYVHNKRNALQARKKHETQKQANQRSMLSNPNVINKEPRRVTLVHQSKFEELEVRKDKAAGAWLACMNQEYEHKMNNEEKRYQWEIQRLDAMRAKQDYQFKLQQQFNQQQKIQQTMASFINSPLMRDDRNINTQTISEKCYQSAPSSPIQIQRTYTQNKLESNHSQHISGANTNYTTPQSYSFSALANKRQSLNLSKSQSGSKAQFPKSTNQNSFANSQQQTNSKAYQTASFNSMNSSVSQRLFSKNRNSIISNPNQVQNYYADSSNGNIQRGQKQKGAGSLSKTQFNQRRRTVQL